MTDVPLRRISISDFRRIEGTRVLPLDAPIVLLHGHNGAGKTSVLSALELALTGEIRSMRRHDPRYTAHLPFHGQDFATISVAVSEQLGRGRASERMTVGGNRIEGNPALDPETAQFYAERCYLDQVSLGQLLDLYQYREGKEESALARFVNELLGLEQLDALRSGLSDADDIRRLKRLSESLASADKETERAAAELTKATADLTDARDELTRSREHLADAMEAVGYSYPMSNDADIGPEVAQLLRTSRESEDRSAAAALLRQITALGGRIEGLSTRPSAMRLEEGRSAVADASAAYERWRHEHGPAIDAWNADAARLGIPSSDGAMAEIVDALQNFDGLIARQNERLAEIKRLENQLAEHRSSLDTLQAQLAEAQEQAGSLTEGLAALREHASDNVCPVCDRDFSEVSSSIHLTAHIDRKIVELSNQGAQLLQFREQRGAAAAALERDGQTLERIRGQLLTEEELSVIRSQRASVASLHKRLLELQPMIDNLDELQSTLHHARATLDELESIAQDAQAVRAELENIAKELNAPGSGPDEPLQDAWRRLAEITDERVAQTERLAAANTTAGEMLRQMLDCTKRVEELKDTVANLAERKSLWDSRVKEAKRRQAVAKEVRRAASEARAEIVHRVFTESLNDVWRSVFMRLAPREYFVPRFGIPTSSRAALEVTLETVHTSGGTGGSPQMMLSAGNLNTAALSLFIALHLAVKPLVPCLVFDDPVQSMDEVHITQFAGLLRILSKRHRRQVIVAVHERQLFEYLALELSPAFEGDELITIELDASLDGPKDGVKRITWTPDPAIAV
ncbi:AAA family ATPase [Mycobacterium sp. E3251]|uniref:AAA family ATPase n=1 Tax=Mycobacterium sp. E3251 TaxID=1834144 RepID=UPI0009ECC75E|nr:AAA family ATPase [Mycobacterium sp. E3251]